MVLPLEPTDVPGVYRRGSKFVVVFRVDGRQRKQAADTMADAHALKLAMRALAGRATRRLAYLRGRPDAWKAALLDSSRRKNSA